MASSSILFVVDYEMETREEWLKETNRLLEEDEFSILNIKLLYEDENIIMYQGFILQQGISRGDDYMKDPIMSPWSDR